MLAICDTPLFLGLWNQKKRIKNKRIKKNKKKRKIAIASQSHHSARAWAYQVPWSWSPYSMQSGFRIQFYCDSHCMHSSVIKMHALVHGDREKKRTQKKGNGIKCASIHRSRKNREQPLFSLGPHSGRLFGTCSAEATWEFRSELPSVDKSSCRSRDMTWFWFR